MSSFTVVTVNCPHCQRDFETGAADSLNVTRMPWAREQILSGLFHEATCTHCGRQANLDRAFLFTDMGRGHFIMVHNTLDIETWRPLEDAADALFSESLSQSPSFTSRPLSYSLRVVFGLPALADKLRVWDAGLDDAVVEVLKLELFASVPALRARGDLLLNVVAVNDSAGHIEIEARQLGKSTAPSFYAASLSRYRELAAARFELEDRFPGLFFRPFSSWRRLAHEHLAAPESSRP
jgi:hypothetical protein